MTSPRLRVYSDAFQTSDNVAEKAKRKNLHQGYPKTLLVLIRVNATRREYGLLIMVYFCTQNLSRLLPNLNCFYSIHC